MHSHLSADSDLSGPQKFHTKIVSRISGIAIAIGIFSATLLRLKNIPDASLEITLPVNPIPTFAIGLTEDLTNKISVHKRFFTMISASLAVFFCKRTSLDLMSQE